MLDRTTTDLLMVASVHHLRSTLEPMPVGLMKLNRRGEIDFIDEYSETLLDFKNSDLKGKPVGTIFGDYSETVGRAIAEQKLGYIGRFMLDGKNSKIAAEIVMVRSIEPHLFSFNIIFAPT